MTKVGRRVYESEYPVVMLLCQTAVPQIDTSVRPTSALTLLPLAAPEVELVPCGGSGAGGCWWVGRLGGWTVMDGGSDVEPTEGDGWVSAGMKEKLV